MTVTTLPPTIPPAPEPPPKSFARRRSIGDRSFATVAVLSGLSVLAILLLISWATTKEAWPIFQHHATGFLFSKTWDPNSNHYGMLAFLFGTVVTSIIALVFAVPLSIGIALFVNEVAPRWLRRPVISVLDLLAVVPSVVFGLWALQVLAEPIRNFYEHVSDALSHIPIIGRLFEGPVNGSSFFTAGLILALMIVPIMTSLIREVFATTPANEKEAAWALGATRWEMVRGAIIPHSKAGMVGAMTIGLGRAMGETIAVALIIGSSPQITAKLFQPGDSMPAVIANNFGEASGDMRAALIGLGVMLFVLTLLVNLSANVLVQRSIRKSRGA